MLSKQLRQIALTACISVVCFRNVRFTTTSIAAQTSGAVPHDTIQRFLADERARWSRHLWKRVKKFFKNRKGGYLIIDDTVIGKDDSAWKTEMTSKLWSSAEKRYLYGQSVVLLVWTDGKTRILLDVRFKVKGSQKTKFDLALEMLRSAKDRQIAPDAVLFDSWYAAASFMTALRKLGWHWVCKLKSNRKLDGTTLVKDRWKTTFGSCKATLAGGIEALVVKDGKAFFATSRLDWKPKQVKNAYRKRWIIEECIKLLKSEFGFETCQARSIPAIQGHAYVCLMSFNTLELFRVQHKLSTLYHIRSVLFNQPIPLQGAWNLNPSIFA
jgi:hypothetical protein